MTDNKQIRITFREYYKLTKETTNYCLKICGIIFTSIYIIIAAITGYKENSLVDSIEVFIICVLLGNGFGGFIWSLAITVSYKQVRNITKFYNVIPIEIKDKLDMRLLIKPKNPKYNYLEMELFCVKSGGIFYFNCDKKNVKITIINDLAGIGNFQKRQIEIQKKYKSERIELTGNGLKQTMNKKDWHLITLEKVDTIFEGLKTVSDKENLKVLNGNFK